MKSHKNNILIYLYLIAALVVVVLISTCVGHYQMSPLVCLKILASRLFGIDGTWKAMDETVLTGLRLPRIAAAMLVGASLAISGASYQSVFQNPLVSPDILGVSSGACVGAALAILMHLGANMIMLMAFAAGVLTVLLTISIPKLLRSDSNIMLVLSGIVVGGVTSSAMGIIKYVADPLSELPQITFWTMGSLDGVTFSTLSIAVIPILVCIIILIRMSWWIDILSMGSRDAQTLGANVQRIRLISILCSTLLTAISVCISGTIGWVGLVVPHFARMFAGSSNTRLIPAAALLGAVFMVAVDTVARTIAKVEVPLGIITGLVGAPFYSWLLYKQRYKLN